MVENHPKRSTSIHCSPTVRASTPTYCVARNWCPNGKFSNSRIVVVVVVGVVVVVVVGVVVVVVVGVVVVVVFIAVIDQREQSF